MDKTQAYRLYIILLSILISSCTGLSKLSDGQKLLTNNSIEFIDKKNIENYKKLNKELNSELSPKPNGKFLWMRPALAIFNSIEEPKNSKGLKHWLKHKIGKPPVFYDEDYSEKMNTAFENRLYHKGYFNAQSIFKISAWPSPSKSGDQENIKTVKIKYIITPKEVYKIDTIIIPKPDDEISKKIGLLQSQSLIKKGMHYNLETLKAERERIDVGLKNLGYYYFDPDYLIFEADSANGNHRVKLKLLLKKDIPKESTVTFNIDKVYVAEDFRLKNYYPDTSSFGDYTMISATNYMKPKLLTNHIFIKKDTLYSKNDHNNTLRQLMGIGAYKYVNARYAASPVNENSLDATIVMTPMQKMSVSTELNAVTKSNSFAGPGLKLSYKSRNFFRGAEVFSLNFTGRFEKQLSGEKEGDTAYEISVDASLDVPLFTPFKTNRKSKPYIPMTNFMIGTGIYARVSLYKFNTFNTGMEYTMRKSQYLTHKFKPIDISVTDLLEASDEFKEFLLLNPSIRTSFEEQFIVGMSYNFIYNHLSDPQKAQYYFSLGADPSGNLLGLVHNLTSKKNNSPENPVKIFGNPVSQYFRFRIDARYYIKTGKESRIATRFYGGIGIPYGNSTVMPYVKQFYSGGTNSIRAFRARSLGPGTYIPPDSLNNVLIDQTGEIKLEANVEYRFPILGFLKGALFTDLGNIWLYRSDSLRPGGKFDVDSFYKEVAVGLGVGLRVDINLVVLRLDLAFPVRKPWLPEDDRWVFDEINLLNSRWRKDNLLWNISIGYPF